MGHKHVDMSGCEEGRYFESYSKGECFMLGIECGLFEGLLGSGKPFKNTCNPANAERLIALCERDGRYVETIDDEDGKSTQMIVGGFKE